LENSAQLRLRAMAFAQAALTQARGRSRDTVKRLTGLKGSFAALTSAGRELKIVARRHASQFVKVNSSLAATAGKDAAAIARTAYAQLARREFAKPVARTTRPSRKRSKSKTATGPSLR
jgi:hypothetical protein